MGDECNRWQQRAIDKEEWEPVIKEGKALRGRRAEELVRGRQQRRILITMSGPVEGYALRSRCPSTTSDLIRIHP